MCDPAPVAPRNWASRSAVHQDDADYGLRAGSTGTHRDDAGHRDLAYGVGDKDDAIDWQAYFHLRNRLVVSALHWDARSAG